MTRESGRPPTESAPASPFDVSDAERAWRPWRGQAVDLMRNLTTARAEDAPGGSAFGASDFDLEHAAEEARAAAQQAAEDATEEATADGRRFEAVPAADLRSAEHVAHRADDLKAAAHDPVVRAGQPTDHLAELIIPGEHTTLVAEDAALAVEQGAEEAAQQPSVDRTQEAADRRRRGGDLCGGRGGHAVHRSEAQAERHARRTDPSYR